MSIYDETVQATGFDPTVAGPSIEFEGWGDLIPPPSLPELIEELADGRTSITWEWRMFNAEMTLRKIAARDDTGPLPIIAVDFDDIDKGEG